MKNVKKYILIISLFLIVMISLLIFFILRYEELHLLSKSRSLLTYLYTLDSGEYKYKSGAIYNENKVFDTNYYFDGIGNIKIDKYNNVKLNIIVGDIKADKDTDSDNLITVYSNCASEFIVDVDMLYEEWKYNGDVGMIRNEDSGEVSMVVGIGKE